MDACGLRGSVLSTRTREGLPDLCIYSCPVPTHPRCVGTQADLDAMPGAVAHVCDGCKERKQPPQPSEFFDRVVVINLERRPDRLEEMRAEFARGWLFTAPTVQKAIDGNLCKAPAGYTQGDYAWACFQSHRQALQTALNDDLQTILILEDDCVFSTDFVVRSVEFFRNLPEDWELAWFGGHHLANPIFMKPGIVRSTSIDRTHAYALNRRGMERLYALWSRWHTGHCDWALSAAIKEFKSYCVYPWLVGQRGGYSDITWTVKPAEWWEEGHGPAAARAGLIPAGAATAAALKGYQPVSIEVRQKFHLEAFPCRFRGEFKRIEHKDGPCHLSDSPCYACSVEGNASGEASLWQYCSSQEMPFCVRCKKRQEPEVTPGVMQLATTLPAEAGPFGGATVNRANRNRGAGAN